MNDLFANEPKKPLADALRPHHLDEVIGQHHLIGPGKPLRLAVEAGAPHSMILWGPPGVGKTTLARILTASFDAELIRLSATFSGVKEIRDAVERAHVTLQSSARRTILLVDEVHRFNKNQQDAFLPFVESGLLTLVAATTENPAFEVNAALLSRAQVYQLKSLNEEELRQLFERAAANGVLDGLSIEDAAIDALTNYADSDARRFLNLLEQTCAAAHTRKTGHIDRYFLSEVLAVNPNRFDKDGCVFYDQISALHKSVRGSNPDAALYWLMRMLDSGADPRYLARRLLRIAWEDIGLADPCAIQITIDACSTYERLGSPEGELALAQAVLYLASSAKSNAGHEAYNKVRDFIQQDKSRPVPVHLRNVPISFMEKWRHKDECRYAHDRPQGSATGDTYLPEGLEGMRWYQPTLRGE